MINNFALLFNLFQRIQCPGLSFYICCFENIRYSHLIFALLNHCFHLYDADIFSFSAFCFILHQNQIFNFCCHLKLRLVILLAVVFALMNLYDPLLFTAKPLSFFEKIFYLFLLNYKSFKNYLNLYHL
jgi:hypothetical protein